MRQSQLIGAPTVDPDAPVLNRSINPLPDGTPSQLRDAVQAILVATYSLAGEEFLARLAEEIASIAGIHSCSIAQLAGTELQMIASFQGGHAPGAEVHRTEIPLASGDGLQVGLLTITHEPGSDDVSWLLEFCAPRVAAELIRIRRNRMRNASAEQFEHLFDHMMSGLVLFEMVRDSTTGEPDFKVLQANPAYESLARMPASEMIGRTVTELFGPLDASLLAMFRRVTETGVPENIEYQAKRNPIYLDLRAYRAGPGQCALLLNDVTARHRSEIALRESEREFRLVWDNAREAMRLSDFEGRILRVNRAFCELFSLSREEAEGQLFTVVLAEEYRSDALASYRRRVASLDVQFHIEREVVLWNGRRLLLEMSNSLLPSDKGERAVFTTFRDITDRQQTEKMLRTLSRAVEQSPASVVITDIHGTILFVNPKFVELTGYSSEESLGQNPRILKSGVMPQSVYADLWSTIKSGNEWHGELCNRKKNGEIYWESASISAIKDENGRISHFVAVKEDITAAKRVADIIRENEERYRALFENSPVPMWEEDFSEVKHYIDELRSSGIQDLRAYLAEHMDAVAVCVHKIRVLDVNRPARDFYGAGSKDELMSGLESVFDSRAFDVVREEICQFAEGAQVFESDIYARTLSGEERLVEMRVTFLPGGEADWSRVVVSFIDVTDRRELEDQLRQSQKMEAIGRLAGGVAHDFNNLLTVINGYSAMLSEQLPPGSSLQPALLEIQRAGERAAELTQQLLAFGRKQMMQPRLLNLNQLILESERLLRRAAGERVELSFFFDPDLGAVKADPTLMNQVIMNLAVNARDAMLRGGKLTIETANVALPDMPSSTPVQLPPGDYVMLAVGDTGIGFDEATRERIFEPFFTTKEFGKGTGLGLATVYGIVSQSGGHIFVDSQPGQGTVFRVLLPRVAAAATEEMRASPALLSGSETVLLVEDQEDVRRFTTQALKVYGYQVLEASGAEEAFRIALDSPQPVHILLTDVVMPKMSGVELARRMSALFPRIRVLFMSGYSDPDDVVGQGPLLRKPFGPATLASRIREVLL